MTIFEKSKKTSLEIQEISEKGLVPVLEIPMNARISCIELCRMKGSRKDQLFITTESLQFSVVEYDETNDLVLTKASGEISDKIGSLADIGQILVIEPEGRMIGLHLYNGLFKVIPINAEGLLQDAYNIRLEEWNIIDMKFLYGTTIPTLVVLYQDQRQMRHVKTFEVSLNDKEFMQGPWNLPNVEVRSSLLITLPLPLGGAIIIGEQSIIYHNGNITKSLAMKQTIMKSYGPISTDFARILLGDYLGRIWLLVLENNSTIVTGVNLEYLGQTSCPSCLVYLDRGVVFVGSQFGDSQLIQLQSKKVDQQFFTVLENYSNLGPILDIVDVVVDVGTTSNKDFAKQTQLVACCGSFKDGSLRVIRNGVGINEHAHLDLPGIRALWSINSTHKKNEKLIVISYTSETRILGICDEELEEIKLDAFEHSQPTLFSCSVQTNLILHVNNQLIYIFDLQTQKKVSIWKSNASSSINVCSYDCGMLFIALGCELLQFEILNGEIKEGTKRIMDKEVSCICCSTIDQSQFVAVGLWEENSVHILNSKNLKTIGIENFDPQMSVRSLLFTRLENSNYFFVGLGDGVLFTFHFAPHSQTLLSDKKKINLAKQPISLSEIVSQEKKYIFACCDRAALISSRNNKLFYSFLNLQAVTAVALLDSISFPESLALATQTEFIVCTIDEIQKTHIKTFPLGEMARKIAHEPHSKTYLVSTIKFALNEIDEQIEKHSLKLFDQTSFELLNDYSLEPYENVESLTALKFADDVRAYYIVGTGFALPNELEPSKGRILIFKISQDQKLILVTQVDINGTVWCLKPFNGKLLAGISSSVALYSWTESNDTFDLNFECEHSNHTHVLNLSTRGDIIFVGDLMRASSVLQYKPLDGKIKLIAVDLNSYWINSVAIIDDFHYLSCESEFNLVVSRNNPDSTTVDERKRLETVGCYHLGDQINVFVNASLSTQFSNSTSPQFPTIVYGTVNGAIGVIATLPQSIFQTLQKIELAANNIIKPTGGFDHQSWRNFKNTRRTSQALNFIDGDLVESILDLNISEQNKISSTIGMSTDELVKLIDEISHSTH